MKSSLSTITCLILREHKIQSPTRSWMQMWKYGQLNCIEQLLETYWAMEAHSTPQVLFCFCFSSYFITTDQTLFSIKNQPTNSKSILDMCCTTNVKRYCSSTYFLILFNLKLIFMYLFIILHVYVKNKF